MLNENISLLLKQAIARRGNDFPATRYSVYKKVGVALEKSLRNKSDSIRSQLFSNVVKCINEVEKSYATRVPTELIEALFQTQSTSKMATPIQPLNPQTVTPREFDKVDFDSERPHETTATQSTSRTFMPILMGIPKILVGTSVLCGLAVLLFWYSPIISSSLNFWDGPKLKTAATDKEISKPTDNLELIFDVDFSNNFGGFVPSSVDASDRISFQEDGSVVISGEVFLTGKELMPIDRQLTYLMTVKLRPTGNNSLKDIGLHAGFATFDKGKKLETEAPGTHRYFVNRGIMTRNIILESDGWYYLSGVITGQGAKIDAFRATTAFVKPILLINLGKKDKSMELGQVKVFKI